MNATLSGRKYYAAIGRLLCENRPEVANELSTLIRGETNLTLLPSYLQKFTTITHFDYNRLIGPLYKSAVIENRRLFIGVILTIYQPHTRSLQVSLAKILHLDKGQMSRLIDETKARYAANCDDMQTRVNEIVAKMREA